LRWSIVRVLLWSVPPAVACLPPARSATHVGHLSHPPARPDHNVTSGVWISCPEESFDEPSTFLMLIVFTF
jgi:hypothetical protein